jgi:hypothetical protein
VPTPLVKRVTEGWRPTMSGTSTVAPNMAKRCWSESGMAWRRGTFSSIWMVRGVVMWPLG